MNRPDNSESGFVSLPEAACCLGSAIRDVEVFRVTNTNVIARGRRYGRQWLLKGLRDDLRGSAIMQRQFQIEDLKTNMIQMLDRTFAGFRKAEDPTGSDNQSFPRLIDILMKTKFSFFSQEIPFAISESEESELEFAFITHYNKILEQWKQILSQYRRNLSAE